MPCPFPGMDPYIERPDLWPDFHDTLIAGIKAALQPLLRPRYAALTQERLYVVEAQRSIRPDVSLLQLPAKDKKQAKGSATLELDVPVIFELEREEIREPLLQIVESASGNRVVTAIEVLSPDNKAAGPGRDSYLRKREEFWQGGTNLVEIDLLRVGEPTTRISAEKLSTLPRGRFLVAVTRFLPCQQEIYSVALQHRLPHIAVPLASDDEDVSLDIQAVFVRCWNDSAYPEMLRYDEPPPGPMSADEIAWCTKLLQEAGFRGSNGQP